MGNLAHLPEKHGHLVGRLWKNMAVFMGMTVYIMENHGLLGVPHFQTKAHMQTTQLRGQIPINIHGWEVATSGLQLQLGMLLGCLYRRIEQIHKHPIIASWFVAVEGVPEQIPTSLLRLFSTNKV